MHDVQNRTSNEGLQLTAEAILEQFDAIDMESFPEAVRAVVKSYREVVNNCFRMKRPKVPFGQKYGFRSSYLDYVGSEEEAAVFELIEELFDALCYTLIFKHMYRKGHGRTMIPRVEELLRDIEEGLLGLILTAKLLVDEAEKLVTLQKEKEKEGSKTK